METTFTTLFNLLGSCIALVMILVFFAFALEIAKEITVSVWQNIVKLFNYIFKKGEQNK